MEIAALVFAIFTFLMLNGVGFKVEKVEKKVDALTVCDTARAVCLEAQDSCDGAQRKLDEGKEIEPRGL